MFFLSYLFAKEQNFLQRSDVKEHFSGVEMHCLGGRDTTAMTSHTPCSLSSPPEFPSASPPGKEEGADPF
jgi:hypothetical protein